MSAAALLAELEAAGFSVTARDNRVLVSPASALTPVLREAIRAGKRDLMAALTAAPLTPYTARARAQLRRWADLGRPVLLMPRRPVRGQTVRPAPYQVPSLSAWFLESRSPVGNDWAERYPEELAALDTLLSELEREQTNKPVQAEGNRE